MANIASILKEEISRIARKEVRGEVAALKKASTTHRTEIAALKRRTSELEKQVKALTRIRAKSNRVAVKDASPKVISFSAKGLASQRKRLDLSVENCGLLVGASGQAIYNWESGMDRQFGRGDLVQLAHRSFPARNGRCSARYRLYAVSVRLMSATICRSQPAALGQFTRPSPACTDRVELMLVGMLLEERPAWLKFETRGQFVGDPNLYVKFAARQEFPRRAGRRRAGSAARCAANIHSRPACGAVLSP